MNKPNLSFWQMWNLSFGFFGVQIAYALQSANISRIFATLGADPHTLSFFWVLPPLMGMIVQPIVGAMSDKTWCKWGRRKPYLYVGAIVAIIVMALLPNAGSFNMTVKAALMFGALMLMLLDTSINMAMQPFKMMVGDMVNEEQKTKAYSIQSLLCNAGSLVGYLFPYCLTWVGIQSVAPEGQIPDTVTWSFYGGAIILIACVLYTGAKVKEWNPEEYARYNNIKPEASDEKTSLVSLLVHAPKVFWQIGLVQFFCWFAFLYMWTYTTGGIAETVWDTINPTTKEYQEAGDWTGVLFAVQAIGSILWAMVIPQFRSSKMAYSVSLVLGAVGFISTYFIHDQYLLFVSFLLIGCAWAAMLALPFALLTNALTGKSLGSYMGLFNCTICLPQIIASLVGGFMLIAFGGDLVKIEVEKDGDDKAKTECVENNDKDATDDVVSYESEASNIAEVEAESVAPEQVAAEVEVDAQSGATVADNEAEADEEMAIENVAEADDEAEAKSEAEVETKEVRGGQIVMLVIAGVALLLGALAVFGISTRRKE